MKLSGGVILCAILAAGCAAAQIAAPSKAPHQAALLATSNAMCLVDISSAARQLTGRPISLAPDAFVRHDSVPLSSVGQSADGRMARPTEILQLRIAADGCKLGLAGRENLVDLRSCECQAAATPLLK